MALHDKHNGPQDEFEEFEEILDEEFEEYEPEPKEQKEAPKKQKNTGVYFAMALCLVALGIGAWATYDTVVKISDVTQNTTFSAAPQSTAEVNQVVSGVPRESVPETVSAVQSSEMESESVAEPEPEEPESTEPEFYSYPLAGQEILNGFSNGDPIYNMTTDDWRTHDGLDLAAQVGQNVMSIGAGTVVQAYEDALWGNVLIIAHGTLEVRYCGLAEPSTLAAGDTVEDGQTLGTVGIVPLEEQSGAHLHLQIQKDGVWIDPTRVLRAQE